MKHENINYLVVGSFVLAVLVAFIVVLGLITGRDGDTENYHAYYNSVAGLKYGTIVSYEGYQLGQVENVEPVQDKGKTRYKVTFSVQSGW
ncbi:MAG: MlaD family protein, partial [Granulosicoccaceae bacterium]